MDFVSLLNTVLLGLVRLALGIILIPFSAYSFPIKGLGKMCFSLGAMCHHTGTCLMYDSSGYSLCHMKKKPDKRRGRNYSRYRKQVVLYKGRLRRNARGY